MMSPLEERFWMRVTEGSRLHGMMKRNPAEAFLPWDARPPHLPTIAGVVEEAEEKVARLTGADPAERTSGTDDVEAELRTCEHAYSSRDYMRALSSAHACLDRLTRRGLFETSDVERRRRRLLAFERSCPRGRERIQR